MNPMSSDDDRLADLKKEIQIHLVQMMQGIVVYICQFRVFKINTLCHQDYAPEM